MRSNGLDSTCVYVFMTFLSSPRSMIICAAHTNVVHALLSIGKHPRMRTRPPHDIARNTSILVVRALLNHPPTTTQLTFTIPRNNPLKRG